MTDPVPKYDIDEVAGTVTGLLDQHRGKVAQSLSVPATTPMFTREESGALVDRNGRVIVPAPEKK